MNKKRSRASTIVSTIVSVALISMAVWIVSNRQFVVDQLNVWNYQPSSQVQTIADRAGLSGKGTFYLYASHPNINSAADFNINCQRREAKSAILGCYVNNNIHIYDVNNAKLDGIEEVTTAHETLHAAWDRLSDNEKTRIGNLLEAEYTKITDPALKERMAYYNRTEPGERNNELHSIIGTEVGTISPELESYYSNYFSDRHKIIALHDAYESVFTQLSTESETLYALLTNLGGQIDSQKNQYVTDATTLSNDIALFNEKAKNGGFSSNTDFNSERNRLVIRTNTLDAERTALNDKIKLYNDSYTKYKALIIQSEVLNKSIDSTVAPAPSL